MWRKIKKRLKSVRSFCRRHIWKPLIKIIKKACKFCVRYKKVILSVAASVVVVNLLIQIFYPTARLLPGTVLSGQDYSFANKSEAVMGLDKSYSEASIDIFFGDNETPYLTVKPIDIGLSVGNAKRISAMEYPWYVRIVPTSIFWYGAIYADTAPSLTFSEVNFDQFITTEFGQDCNIKPINANLEINGTGLRLIKASSGGTCKIDEVTAAIHGLNFADANYANVRIAMDVIEPDVTNDDARRLASSIGTKLLSGLTLSLGDGYGTTHVSPEELALWLEFEVIDKKLTVAINSERSAKYFEETVAPLVARAAGVSIITTNNLDDVIRESGVEGKMINIKETNQRIAEYLMDQRTSVDVAIQSIEPEVQYARSFDATSAGITSFVKYFVQTHPGRFGVQLYEIGGESRAASYYPDREFVVAGAARAVLAYGMLALQAQNLPMSSNDNDWPCFNNTLRRYETSCVSSLAYSKIRQDRFALGLDNTSISSIAGDTKSTAADLAEFLMKIHNGQIVLTDESRSSLLDNMKYAEPRDGIASVIDGALSASGHSGQTRSDVALVSSGGRSYVIAILTDDSSWSDIADLAKQIDGFIRR